MVCVNKNDPAYQKIEKEYTEKLGIKGFVVEALTLSYWRENKTLEQQGLNDEIRYPTEEYLIEKLKDDSLFNMQEAAKKYGILPKMIKAIFPNLQPKDALAMIGQGIILYDFSDMVRKFHLGFDTNSKNHKMLRETLGGKSIDQVFDNLDVTKDYNKDSPEYWLKKIVVKNSETFEKFFNQSIKAKQSSKLNIESQQSTNDFFNNRTAMSAIKLLKNLVRVRERLYQGFFNLNSKDKRFANISKQVTELENHIDNRSFDLGISFFVRDFYLFLEDLRMGIQNNEYTSSKQLQYLSEIIDFYKPMLQDVRSYLESRENFEDKLEEDLNEIVTTLGITASGYTNKHKLESAISLMIENLNRIEKEKTKRSVENTIQYAIDYIKRTVKNAKIQQQEIDKLRKYATKNDYDDSIFRKFFGSIGRSKDIFLRVYHSIMRDINLQVQSYTYNLGQEIFQKAADLGINIKDFNSKITDPKNEYNFISEYDYEYARAKQAEAFSKLNSQYGLSQDKDIANETRRLWKKDMDIYLEYLIYQKAGVLTPDLYIAKLGSTVIITGDINETAGGSFVMTIEDYIKSDQFRDNQKEMLYSEAVRKIKERYYKPHPDAANIIARNKQLWGEDSIRFRYWRNENIAKDKSGREYYKNELLVPKKLSDRYLKLTDNEKTFLNYLLEVKREADAKIPFTTELLRKPQIKSDWVNSVFKKGNIKEAISEGFNFTIDSDDTMFGNEPVRRADGSLAYNIPTHFIRKVKNPKRLTTDTIGSIILYAQMAENNQQKRRVQPEYESLLETLMERETTLKGEKKKSKETAIVQELINFIETNLYGIYKTTSEDDHLFGTNISKAKLFTKFNDYGRNNNLALRFSTAFVGTLTSTVAFNLEKLVGTYVSKGASTQAQKVYRKHMFLALGETGKTLKKNKLSKVLQSHFVLQDIEQMFSNSDFNTALGKKLATDKGYVHYMTAEHGIKSNIMLSLMHSYRLYNGRFIKQDVLEDQGVEWRALPTYWEALKETGRSFKYDVADPKQELTDMQKRVSFMINDIDGRINTEDRASAHRHFLGQFLTTHRAWLFRGIDKRFGNIGYNYETGHMEGGYYSLTKNFISHLYNEKITSVKQALLVFDELEKHEQDAVKRVMYEALLTTGFITLGTLINFLASDDDNDEYLFQYMAYLFTRTYIEFTTLSALPAIGIGFGEEGELKLVNSFVPPILSTQLVEVLQSPVTGVNQINNFMEIANFMEFGDEIQTGPYKNMTKGERFAIKLIPGLRGLSADMDPQSSRTYLLNNAVKYW